MHEFRIQIPTKNQKVVRFNKNNNSFQFDKYYIIDYIYYVKKKRCVRINIANILFDVKLWTFEVYTFINSKNSNLVVITYNLRIGYTMFKEFFDFLNKNIDTKLILGNV